MVNQLLPIGNLAMFEYELQGDILEEQVFGRTKDERRFFSSLVMKVSVLWERIV